MSIHADKTSENKSHSIANGPTQKKGEGRSTFQLAGNQPEAIAQRKLQEMANNSPRILQLNAYQEIANNGPHVKQFKAVQTMADNFASKTAQRKENKTGLPDNLKSGIENLSGHSMDDVRVHYNSNKPAQLQAHAYAQGTNIHLAPGQEKHLPHEAWHVVQQKQGRVKPTMQMKGEIAVNDDTGLEKEADVMGKMALQSKDQMGYPVKTSTKTHSSAPVQRKIKDELAHYTKEIEKLSGVDIEKVSSRLAGLQSAISKNAPRKVGGVRNVKASRKGGGPELKLLQERKRLSEEETRLKALKANNNPDIQKLEKLKAAKIKVENKKKLVAEVLRRNIKQKKHGWFELNDDQLNIYTDAAFHMLEKIRHTDMTTLMIAHQQVNDEAKATPEEKAKTLRKHINYLSKQIEKFKNFDVEIPTKQLSKTETELKALIKPDKARPRGAKTRVAKPPVALLKNRKDLQNEILRLQGLKNAGSPEIEKLEKLKLYKAKLEREHQVQTKLKGKEDVNIDFLNTTETGKDGKDVVRAYMAIVAPNYDNAFKDFYLTNKKQLTYSANDKALWVSFGTPIRTLSWFQKYSFEAKGDNVPLVRSFLVPQRYFDKHIKNIATESTPALGKGKTLRSHPLNVDLEQHYGAYKKGEKYQSNIHIIDPYLINVDIKYPNQFEFGRSIFAEEEPKDPKFFAKTEADTEARKRAFDDQKFDEHITNLDKEIEELKAKQEKINDLELDKRKLDEILADLPKIDISKAKGLQQWFKDAYANDSPFPENKKEQAIKVIKQLQIDVQINTLDVRLKTMKAQKAQQELTFKDISKGDNKLKGIVSESKKHHEDNAQIPGGMVSTLMTELIKQAIPDSFKTIALAGDRKHEHVEKTEGELEDISVFLKEMGLDYQNESPSSHMLDESSTAFHYKKADGTWASQTPEMTNKIYTKMRFFYHALDAETAIDQKGPSPESIAKVPVDKLDISKDSHLMKVIAQFGVNKKVNPDVERLAQAYESTDIKKQLSALLNENHLTPANVFGLPKEIDSTRKDRFGNNMARTAFETFFAEKEILSEKSLVFIEKNVGLLIAEINKPAKAAGLLASILGNSYLKRDMQQMLGTKSKGGFGVEAEIPFDKSTILSALNKLKKIRTVEGTHDKLRMVYLFFHILRPYASKIGERDGIVKADPIAHPSKKIKSKDVTVNNRKDQPDNYNFLNPQLKSFGILDRPFKKDKRKDMPYDKFKSTQRYTAKDGNEMTEYMKNLNMPFIGGVSGTTRDQSQVLEDIFTEQTLKDSYWDFQLLNAAFMIGNSYHSFFETIYVAARYDKYTDKGKLILQEFDKATQTKKTGIDIYIKILEILEVDEGVEEGFKTWYNSSGADKANIL